MFSLICAQINGWVNNAEAGDFRRHRTHYDVTVMKCIFLNENVWILIKISLKFVPKCPFNNNPSLVLVTAWRRTGDEPLSEPMMFSLVTHASLGLNESKKLEDLLKYLSVCIEVTILVLKPEYSEKCVIIKAADALALASQRDQQPWYRMCRINASLYSTRKDFNYLCQFLEMRNLEM